MIGYLKPYYLDMKICEFNQYRSFYCGICNDIKKQHGQLYRFLLNYDITFMGVVLTTYFNEEITVSKYRCPLNPISAKDIYSSKWTQYVADINCLFVYHKLLDNDKDKKNTTSRVARKCFEKKYRQISQQYDKESNIMSSYVKILDEYERNESQDYVQIGKSFGEALKCIFEEKCDNDVDKRLIGTLFYYIGQWIYNIDALDDIEKDIKNQEYNPFKIKFTQSKTIFLEEIEVYFNQLLYEINNIHDLLDVQEYKGVVSNLLCTTIRCKTEKVLMKYKDQ